ncbi:hypothetical protein GCM10010389_25700 [Streptomyces echinoruber]|uniref:Uncharacterized protein n=1 Tax=Streptomyces echinoruber TaxID=68898 RepID=A0A918R4B2_9ACTN|nr:hypothetical protein GCM10010389_25700 [Streptomyces echinoruber]
MPSARSGGAVWAVDTVRYLRCGRALASLPSPTGGRVPVFSRGAVRGAGGGNRSSAV